MKKDCADIGVDMLYDYLEGTLIADHHTKIETHLLSCTHCREFISLSGKATRLSRELFSQTMPEDVKERLKEFVQNKILG